MSHIWTLPNNVESKNMHIGIASPYAKIYDIGSFKARAVFDLHSPTLIVMIFMEWILVDIRICRTGACWSRQTFAILHGPINENRTNFGVRKRNGPREFNTWIFSLKFSHHFSHDFAQDISTLVKVAGNNVHFVAQH